MSVQRDVFRFSTDLVPLLERSRAIHDLRDRGILPIEPLDGRTIQLDVVKWSLPGVAILSGAFAGIRQLGDPRLAGDDLFFGVNLFGQSVVAQGHSEIVTTQGDGFVLQPAAGSFHVLRPTPTQFIGLRVPRNAIDPLLSSRTRGSASSGLRPIPGTTASVMLLVGYLQTLLRSAASPSPEAAAIVSAHVQDLVALSLGATRDAVVTAEERSVPAVRLRAIKSQIVAHLGDERLSVRAVAARHGITPRYVHRLFELDGTTYTQFVLQQRLDCAYRLLRNPRFADRSISSIAYDVGFGDLSYFNRAFRRRYGDTPSGVRKARSRERM